MSERAEEAFHPSSPVCASEMPRLSELTDEKASLGQALASRTAHMSTFEPGHHAPQESPRRDRPPEKRCDPGGSVHGMGRARKLDPHLPIPVVGDALRRPMHLTKDVDWAGVQREAIKLIKGTERMSCEGAWRAG